MESKILVEQELLILPVHPSSPPVFSEYFYLRFYYYHWAQVIWFYFPRIWLSCLGLLVLFPHNLAILFKSDDFISPEFSYPVICHLSSGFISPEFGYPVICHLSSVIWFYFPRTFLYYKAFKKISVNMTSQAYTTSIIVYNL